MSQTTRNLLVVEDDQEWCSIYFRAANQEDIGTIKIAQDLSQAEAFIDEMQFAVAFIDIGLNVVDDRNVDGIRVMEKIRGSADPTSIVVVTGRSGRDVLPITRDAIKKYGALDIIGKADIAPRDIRALLRDGVRAFSSEIAARGESAQDALRGAVPRTYWDDQMLRATAVRDGVQGLRGFLDGLLGDCLPLVTSTSTEAVSVDQSRGFVHGAYWSRASGRAIAVFYGGKSAADEIDAARSSGMLLNRYAVGQVLKRSTAHGLSGAIFALEGQPREAFSGLG